MNRPKQFAHVEALERDKIKKFETNFLSKIWTFWQIFVNFWTNPPGNPDDWTCPKEALSWNRKWWSEPNKYKKLSILFDAVISYLASSEQDRPNIIQQGPGTQFERAFFCDWILWDIPEIKNVFNLIKMTVSPHNQAR